MRRFARGVRATAIALLLLVARGLTAQDFPVAPVHPPVLQYAEVGRDTVWFFEDPPRAEAPTSSGYAFVRSSGAWVRVPSVGRPPARPILPSERDTIPVGGGLALVSVPGENGDVETALYSPAARREHRLHVRVDLARRARLAAIGGWSDTDEEGERKDGPSVSRLVSAWAGDSTTLWLGLAGGFDEGDGQIGGLLRVDRRTLAIEPVLDTLLANVRVSGVALVDGAVWVATYSSNEWSDGSEATQ